MRPYRDTITVKRQPDGQWQAKLHGYPFFWDGSTAEEALRHAGASVDMFEAQRARMIEDMAAMDKIGMGTAQLDNEAQREPEEGVMPMERNDFGITTGNAHGRFRAFHPSTQSGRIGGRAE